MKVNFDLQVNLMASSLYRILSSRIGNGYQNAKSRYIFRNFVDANGNVIMTEKEILIRFQKRAHNHLLIAAGFDKVEINIPWLGRKRIRFIFG